MLFCLRNLMFLIDRPADENYDSIYYRPVTRLAFWWSHAIPVIVSWFITVFKQILIRPNLLQFYPTQTYKEATESLDLPISLSCLDVECILNKLDLLNNTTLRCECEF
jgi:hypothetical protein